VKVALALVFLPALAALVAFAVPSNTARPWIVPVAAFGHLALVVWALGQPLLVALDGWIVLDDLGKLVLAFTSVFFAVCALYAPGYLRLHRERDNRVFCMALLALLATLTLIAEAHHLGLMWVALEASTLASAPLVYWRRTPQALEAVWKYLLVGSVGIAIALLGSLFLAYSALKGGAVASLLFEDLVRDAPLLSRPWLDSAFVLLFIGYGTKMGLAPMHTWKPDAYGEAPGLVGALLAGGLTNCAFLAILRFYRIVSVAGDGAFARQMMIVSGILSMTIAGVFMARQRDFKRMLAYSSVEHMGILVVGVGIGGAGVFGSLYHLLNNGLTKGVLFLSAANIHRAFASKSTTEVSGALRRVPVSAGLFLAGFFAITGSPPFGPFLSEFTIVSAALTQGHWVVGTLFLVLLIVIFVGMGATVLAVVQGKPPPRFEAEARRESFLTVAPVVAFIGGVLMLGLYLPRPLDALLQGAAGFVQGNGAGP
jgi:hydrogenase-4 component F